MPRTLPRPTDSHPGAGPVELREVIEGSRGLYDQCMSGYGIALVCRREVDLVRVASAVCRPGR